MQQNEKEIKSDLVIAIDGPAGSGKSTVAKLLAQRLGYTYVDTGAMYRALTLKAIKNNISLDDEPRLVELSKNTSLDIINKSSGELVVLLDGEDVAHLIRTPELTNKVAYIARIKGIRESMKLNQQRIGSRGRCVFEGRDIGTVIFPQAKYKFYLDADFQERVRRRYKELVEKRFSVSEKELAQDLHQRDHKDITRPVGPLKQADDAIYIDTTDLSIQQVVDKLASYINS